MSAIAAILKRRPRAPSRRADLVRRRNQRRAQLVDRGVGRPRERRRGSDANAPQETSAGKQGHRSGAAVAPQIGRGRLRSARSRSKRGLRRGQQLGSAFDDGLQFGVERAEQRRERFDHGRKPNFRRGGVLACGRNILLMKIGDRGQIEAHGLSKPPPGGENGARAETCTKLVNEVLSLPRERLRA